MFRSGVRPSVCLSHRSIAAAAVGFPAERRYRSIVAGAVLRGRAAGAGAQQQLRVASCSRAIRGSTRTFFFFVTGDLCQ